MTIRLFLVDKIDYDAVDALAALIYSFAVEKHFISSVEINEKNIEFKRIRLLAGGRHPLSSIGLVCRGGKICVAAETQPSPVTATAAGLQSAPAMNDTTVQQAEKLQRIRGALLRLTDGYTMQAEV